MDVKMTIFWHDEGTLFQFEGKLYVIGEVKMAKQKPTWFETKEVSEEVISRLVGDKT